MSNDSIKRPQSSSHLNSEFREKASEYPELLTPDQRVRYQNEVWNVPTTKGTLAVHRSLGRGVRWAKINSRIYYRKTDVDWHIENAKYIETIDSITRGGAS